MQRVTQIQTITIASGGTESSPVIGDGWAAYGLILPSQFTSTSITFLVGISESSFWGPLRDKNNAVVTVTVVANTPYDLPEQLAAWPFWKIVSSAPESAVRSLIVAKKS